MGWGSDGVRLEVEISGHVELFGNDVPCLSCLAVFVQFVRDHPNVRLSVDFDTALPSEITTDT